MKFCLLLFSLLLSSALYAQKTLNEARVEENLFIMKIVAVVVLLLAAMPFLLRKLDARVKQKEYRLNQPAEEWTEEDEEKPVVKNVVESKKIKSDLTPIDVALETLLIEHDVPEEKREEYGAMFRRYLEIRMGKTDVKTGSFDINSVFEAVTTKIHSLEPERNFELIFNIDGNVPSQVIGDAERMTDILIFALHHIVVTKNARLIEMRIRRLNLADNSAHLEIYIPYGKDDYQANNLDIFTPFGEKNSLLGLELYLAREYARIMHGDVTFELQNDNDSAIVIEIRLYMSNPNEMRHYRLPSKTMTGHSVLLVDDHIESALAVKNMFVYFKNDVDILSSKELFGALEMLEDYDIVVIQERFFSHKLIAKVKEIKSSRPIKTVSLNKNQEYKHSIEETLNILDGEICKPVTVQKVFSLLVALYSSEDETPADGSADGQN